jgi:hypothetical protein
MANYRLDQLCRPSGSLRVSELAVLLSLISRVCGVATFEVAGEGPIAITPEALEGALQAALTEAPFAGAGADLDVFGRLGSGDEYIRCEIHAGTASDEPFIDFYNVVLGERGPCIGVDEFKEAVQAIRPFEAFLAERNNEADLDAYNRQQQLGFFTAPAIIRALHYFDRELAASIGGIERCLKAPASRVEPFLDGVLIQLVEGPFDPTNADHLRRQQDVMSYLGIGASARSTPSGHPAR